MDATVQSLIAQALRHQQAGQFSEAERLYQELLAADSNQADALRLLGSLTYVTGRPDRAIELLSRAIALDPNLSDAHNDLAMTDIVIEALRFHLPNFDHPPTGTKPKGH